MTALLEGALVGYAVTKILDEVLEIVKPAVQINKHYEALRDLLQSLKPLVERCASHENSDVKLWLRNLQARLLEAGEVAEEFNKQGRLELGKRIRVSRKLILVTNGIKSLLEQAGLITVALQGDHNTEEFAGMQRIEGEVEDLKRMVQVMFANQQKDLKLMRLANATKNAVNTPSNNYGGDFGTITPSRAFEEIRAQVDDGILSDSSSNMYSSSDDFPSLNTAQRSLPMRMVSAKVFGGDGVVETMKSIVLSTDDGRRWAGVWSMGGAGKTVVAERLCNEESIREHFVGGIFWITVGRGKRTRSVLQNMLEVLEDDDSIITRLSSEGDLKNLICQNLRKRGRLLMVLDDVWEAPILDALDAYVLDQSSSESKIFVTTRNEEILERKCSDNRLRVPMLSKGHSWQLFCWHAFHGIVVPPSLQDLAEKVVNECKGLPLALKVTGAAMAGKTARSYWQMTLKKLERAEVINDEHHQLYRRLQPSVDNLSEIDEHLKDCFYYFAAFPEDASVNIDDLLSIWVGEGIAGSKSTVSAEDEAYALLGYLISRCMIELCSTKSGKGAAYQQEFMKCKIHDVLRDLARQNLQNDQNLHQRLCLYEPGETLPRFPPKWDSYNKRKPFAVVRISLMNNELETLPSRFNAPNLQVLLLRNNTPLLSLPKNFFKNLQQLRVLDLRSTGIEEIPAGAFASLKLLGYLDLSSCRKLQKVPESIRNLENLKDLHLSGCRHLGWLPSGIKNLTKLQRLHVFGSPVWDEEGRRDYTCMPAIWPTRDIILEDLGALTQLTSLRLSKSMVSNRGPTYPLTLNLNAFKLLKHLHLQFSLLQSLPDISELRDLQTLKLGGCAKLSSLPAEIRTLPELMTLDLAGCISLSHLPPLDELPMLEWLDLSGCTRLLELPTSFSRLGGFPCLKELTADHCHNIDISASKFPVFQPGSMPSLSILSLLCWTQLVALPLSLQSLTGLLSLSLRSCSKLESLGPPFDWQGFTKLEQLNVDNTARLMQLPDSLASLPQLRTLRIKGCPAQDHLPSTFLTLEEQGRLEIIRN